MLVIVDVAVFVGDGVSVLVGGGGKQKVKRDSEGVRIIPEAVEAETPNGEQDGA